MSRKLVLPPPELTLHLRGVIGAWQVFDRYGRLKRQGSYTLNGVTTAGKNDALDKYFAGSAYTATWYVGYINNTPAPTLAAADTMASHAGWAEFTSYDQATRPTLSWSAASGGSKSSSGAVDITISTGGPFTIYGMFLASVNTKGGTTGILWNTGAFASPQTVATADTFRISSPAYSITLSG